MKFFAHRPTYDPTEVQVYACRPLEVDDLLGLYPTAEPITRRQAAAIHGDPARFSGLYDDGVDPAPLSFSSATRNCRRSTSRLLTLAF